MWTGRRPTTPVSSRNRERPWIGGATAIALSTSLAVILSSCSTASTAPEEEHVDRQAEAEEFLAFSRDMADCLTEAGFPSTYREFDGGISVSGGTPEEQRAARMACEETLGGVPESPPLSAEELGALYDLEIEAYACLVDHGYEPAPPSSKEQFVATYATGESWYAHQSPVEGGVIPDTQCPQPDPADVDW